MPQGKGVLLDTHAVLWLLAGDPRTPEWLRETGSALYLSDASIWEVAIKRSLGKLETDEEFPQQVRELGILRLEIDTANVWEVGQLPWHHRDPFDRLIIVQAIATRDSDFERYDVEVLWDQGSGFSRSSRRRFKAVPAAPPP